MRNALAKTSTAEPVSAFDLLTRRQKIFVEHFAAGCTGVYSVRQAGYKGAHANVVAYRWANRPEVRAAIEERQKELAEDVGVRQHVVLRQMLAIATLDPRKLVDEKGDPIPLHKLDDATAAAIAGLEIESVSSNGLKGTRYKYKFGDKVKAGVQLGQYVGVWQPGTTNVNVDARQVHLNGNGAGAGVLRAIDDLVARASAVGVSAAPALPDPDGPVLPAAVCDGAAGRGSPVDAGAHPRGAGET